LFLLVNIVLFILSKKKILIYRVLYAWHLKLSTMPTR